MPKRNKNYILERQVEKQGNSISQLLGENEELKKKATRYMEQAHMYRAEKRAISAHCEEVEELLMQKEKAITEQNNDIEKYQKTIEELKAANDIEADRSHEYFCALVNKQAECRKLKAELEEARKPWYKKLFRGYK